MIHFFRKIRKKLASDNKPFKYMRYAIGEIVLVVVGILIALQINNWNEERKENLKEVTILRHMKETLIDDIEMKRPIRMIELAIMSSRIISDHLENNKPYKDSLNYYFGCIAAYAKFMPNMSAFDNLTSIGFDKISNDSLRDRYQKIYRLHYKLLDFQSNVLSEKMATRYTKRM